ncbi:hypothetical protein ACVWZR_001376 [Bradyrhizobium sp. i1.3.1]
MSGYGLKQIAARESRARGLDRGLIFTRRVIGKALARCLEVRALDGLARQAFGGLALPRKIVTQHHAAAGGAVVGEQAIGDVEHDVALIIFACALLHEVLDLEHEVVGEGAEQAEQPVIVGGEGGDEIAHQRHHAGAPRALVFLDRRIAADDVAGKLRGALLGDHDAGLVQHVCEEGDQHLAAFIERFQLEIDASGLELERRIGEAEVKALVAAGHGRARGQHHAAAAVEQVDEIVEPVGAAGELLRYTRDRETAAGHVVASGREGKDCPVHVVLLRNLPRKRHTGQTIRPPVHCVATFDDFEK